MSKPKTTRDRHQRWMERSRYTTYRRTPEGEYARAADGSYIIDDESPPEYHWTGPRNKHGSDGFKGYRAGVTYNLLDLEPTDMTDDEAFAYHETQMLRHMAEVQKFAAKLSISVDEKVYGK